jgi:nicotinate-nucleotide--dimethylbenzimidazole phosphoribosyltransferase
MRLEQQHPDVAITEGGFSEAERLAVYKAIAERRDIRHFRPDPVPDEVLRRVLWAAHHAGSVGFMQPWDFVVVRDAGRRRLLQESAERQRQAAAAAMGAEGERASQFMRLKVEGIGDCSLLIVVTVDPTRGGDHVLGRYSDLETDAYSASCAIQNLWLAARTEGLGMGWVSFFHPGEVQRALGIPPHVRPLAILCLGWPDAFPARPLLEAVGWETRRALKDLVHVEEWGNKMEDMLAAGLSPIVIVPPDADVMREAAARQDRLTKPAGSLGRLEELSVRLAGMAGRLDPPLAQRVVFTFAGDHGVTAERVSAYPSEVTPQMVLNFLAGGAAINVLARQMGARVVVADFGVAADLPPHPELRAVKVRRGTGNIAREPAMTRNEAIAAVETGRRLFREELAKGLDVALTGDMGIGNTTCSAALICAFTGLPPRQVVGRGTGVDNDGLARKLVVVERALDLHRASLDDPLDALAAIGGLEVAGLVGVILEAACQRRPVIVDGFISGAAAMCAAAIAPGAKDYMIAAHRSQELGHAAALASLGLKPLLDLDLRLGEGTGAVLALPLLDAAVRILNEMATFDEAGVSERDRQSHATDRA